MLRKSLRATAPIVLSLGCLLFGLPGRSAAQGNLETPPGTPGTPPATGKETAAEGVPPPPGTPPEAPPLPPPPVYTTPSAPPAAPPPARPASPPLINFTIPKAFSLTAGWSYTPNNSLPLSSTNSIVAPEGINIDGAFMWQVRGFDGIRWPAWVGFMAGFFYYFGQTGVQDSLGLDYGIYVKHALFPGPRLRLFFGYGLGAAQVWIRDTNGRGIGAFERLSVGIDTHLVRFLHMTLEFSYRFFDLPTFQLQPTDSPGYDFQTMSILAGFWLGR